MTNQPSSTAHVPTTELNGERIDPVMTTTGLDLVGYRVTRNGGVVRGIAVRSRSLFGTLGGSLQTLVGGDISVFARLCEETRQEAYVRMLQQAARVGGNAVIGVRYDANEIMGGVTEVLCYGTAVVVTPT